MRLATYVACKARRNTHTTLVTNSKEILYVRNTVERITYIKGKDCGIVDWIEVA
jgi:hypothetical protein